MFESVVFFLQQNMMFYKMRFKVSNPTAMNMPDPSISPDGVVPTTLSSKSLKVTV